MDELPNAWQLLKGPVGHPDVIGVLEKMLVEARAGRVVGVAIVAVGGGGEMQAVTSGAAAPVALYTGCGLLQQQVLASMTQRPSPILRARG